MADRERDGPTTATAPPEPTPADRKRLIAHLLMDEVPDAGLAEALESLAEMVAFYRGQKP